MQIFYQKSMLLALIESTKTADLSIGFVPTMGALHEGHLSLMQQSLKENDLTIVSIFVNPTQFNNPDDLKKYPRTLDTDIEKINNLNKNIVVFAPSVEEIYGNTTTKNVFDFDGLEFEMEGKHRPGHFDGVGTVVKKLFEITQPKKAYFGEKDFQQLQIIKKLVLQNHISVEIVPCPIFREPNGLAMSSRNERLTQEDREKSAIIFKVLQEVCEKSKKETLANISDWVSSQFKDLKGFELEYFEIARETDLKSVKILTPDDQYRAFIAVFVNNIRLIDNISLK